MDRFRNGFFETFIHWELERQGFSLYLMPSAIVFHKKNNGLKEAVAQCYHHGRSFGGMRVSNVSLAKRIGFALGSFILPILLPLRITIRTIRKERHVRESLLSLPYLLLLMASWSFGEFFGYVGGVGNSSNRWT